MTASAFKFNQLVKTPTGRGYVISTVIGKPGWYRIQIIDGAAQEFEEKNLTPITEDKKAHGRNKNSA